MNSSSGGLLLLLLLLGFCALCNGEFLAVTSRAQDGDFDGLRGGSLGVHAPLPVESESVALLEIQDVVETATRIDVQIDTHYAVTTFTRTFVNNHQTEAALIPFSVTIPSTAFITGFLMEVDGELFIGVVLTASEADVLFEEAVEEGETAGRIRASDVSDDLYEISANIEAGSTVTFQLSYDQLLTRRFGWLEYSDLVFESDFCENPRDNSTCTIFRPTIGNVPVEIDITEPEGISTLEVLNPSRPQPEITVSDTSASVKLFMTESFVLTLRYQTDRSDISTFVVDSNRDYFVHLFSPPNLDPLLKAIVLVLDKSGSMSGNPYEQVKDASIAIIESLLPEEFVNIILFDGEVYPTSLELLPATDENKEIFIQSISDSFANGVTNINDPLLMAIDMLKEFQEEHPQTYAHEIIFLTDGQPNQGVSNTDQILENVREANTELYPIFAVGLGQVDFEFIRLLAVQSGGIERVFQESDSVFDELIALFEEINEVLLSDISIDYVSDYSGTISEVTNVPKTLFEGSEVLVSGQIPSRRTSVITAIARGTNAKGEIVEFGGEFDLDELVEQFEAMRTENDLSEQTEPNSQSENEGEIEVLLPEFEVAKIWALLKLNDLQLEIDMLDEDEDQELIEELIEEATNLALQYQLVTEYTSFIVVEQNAVELCENSVDFEVCVQESSDLPPQPPSPSRNYLFSGYIGYKNAPEIDYPNGVCTFHDECDEYSYCDELGACLPCGDCWIYVDAFDDLCPECLLCGPDLAVQSISRSTPNYYVVYCNEGDAISTVEVDMIVKADGGFEYEVNVPVPSVGTCDHIDIPCELLGDPNCEEEKTVIAIAHFQSIYCEVPATNDELIVEFGGSVSSHSRPSSSGTSSRRGN